MKLSLFFTAGIAVVSEAVGGGSTTLKLESALESDVVSCFNTVLLEPVLVSCFLTVVFDCGVDVDLAEVD